MKYIKKFELYHTMVNISTTEEDIQDICKEYGIEHYNINDDMSIDVYDNVNISVAGLTEMPLEFRYVSGNFICRSNKLTTLKGSPIKVGGDFSCTSNNLTSLEYAPIEIGNDFTCLHNNITSLKYAPSKVDGKISYVGNPLPVELTSLDHASVDILFKHQEDYGVWNSDGTFNKGRFELLNKELLN